MHISVSYIKTHNLIRHLEIRCARRLSAELRRSKINVIMITRFLLLTGTWMTKKINKNNKNYKRIKTCNNLTWISKKTQDVPERLSVSKSSMNTIKPLKNSTTHA